MAVAASRRRGVRRRPTDLYYGEAMNILEKLRSLADEIETNENALKTQEAWALVGRLASRAPVNQEAAQRAIKAQDLSLLKEALGGGSDRADGSSGVADADSSAVRPDEADGAHAAHASPPGAGAEISSDDLAAAMRAFKKRLKLARLNEESRLGSRQLTGGRKSSIDAIVPPSEYGPEVWRTLAERGRLVHTGGGFYSLPT